MDLQFNIAKGRDVAYIQNVIDNTPVNSVLVLAYLTVKQADGTIRDHRNFQALMAANTEAAFTNYQRIELDQSAGITITIDDTADTVTVDIPDQAIASAGGTTDESVVAAVIGYKPDSTVSDDTTIIPLYKFDVTGTTNGNTFTFVVHANGLITH